MEITGRCYCGAVGIAADGPPKRVVYCHCADCKRSTGAPVAAYAAFAEEDVRFDPLEAVGDVERPGARRSFCKACGSPVAGRYEYLPGQVYVPLGVLDQAEVLGPEMHAHWGERYGWLCLRDDLARVEGSSRDLLRE